MLCSPSLPEKIYFYRVSPVNYRKREKKRITPEFWGKEKKNMSGNYCIYMERGG
jgi:hypothetical protein